MIKIITILFFLVAGIFQGMAQSDGIRFEQGKSWKEILEKAEQEKKLVFVDCYASWCGPCKMMAKNIFTLKKVGDYFNAHFINVKLDIEKEADGRMIAGKYQVNSLPTLLFIQPATGEVMQRLAGERGDQELIAEAKEAQSRYTDPDVWRAYQEKMKQRVSFEPALDWKQVVKKAKKEKKLIFLVLGNGSEKAVEDLIFVRDTIYNYYNRHFVNVRCDVEKEGHLIHLNEMYPLKNLPVWAFVDPVTLNVIHQSEGMGDTEWFLHLAQAANDPQANLRKMIETYDAGKRDTEFVGKYLKVLLAANLPGQDTVVRAYLDSLTVEELATPQNWQYFLKYVNDPLSPAYRQVMAYRERFYTLADRQTVDYFLDIVLNNAVMSFVAPLSSVQPFDEKYFTELIHYLQSVDYPAVPGALAQLYAVGAVRRKDYRSLVESMRYAFRFHVLPADRITEYLKSNLKALAQCPDRSVVRQAMQVLDEKCSYTGTFYGKADLMEMKAGLQKQIGDSEGAKVSVDQAEAYRKQGDESGEW